LPPEIPARRKLSEQVSLLTLLAFFLAKKIGNVGQLPKQMPPSNTRGRSKPLPVPAVAKPVHYGTKKIRKKHRGQHLSKSLWENGDEKLKL
jgi:hypothetical protein